MNALIITFLVLLVLVIFYLISIYNKLVSLRNQFKNAFSQIDVQLKRRYDLIPNLVETVKGYMAHERQTLEAVIQARNQAVSACNKVASNPTDANSMKQLVQAEGQLTGAVGKIFALAESYPDLKASQNMSSLQEELTSTENKVAFARQSFNDSVMSYNTACEVFPNIFIAQRYGFKHAQLFEIQDNAEKATPQVQF